MSRTNRVEETLHYHFLERNLERGHSNYVAIHTPGKKVQYNDLFLQSCRFANLLLERGIRKGDRVAFLLPDCPLYAELIFGTSRVGAIAVPMSPRLSIEDYRRIFNDCRPSAIVFSVDLATIVQLLCSDLSIGAVLWSTSESSCEQRGDTAIFPELLAAPSKRPSLNVRTDDNALIQYTSGSTGRPKGVVHRHAGLVATREVFAKRLSLDASDVCYSTARLSFGYGFGNSVLFPFGVGASCVLDECLPDPGRILKVLEVFRPSVFFSVPRTYQSILRLVAAGPRPDLTFLRSCVSAGEHLTRSLFESWKLCFGLEIANGIGTTECLHIFISGVPGRLVPGGTGELVPNCEAKLVAGDQTVQFGPGELWIKSVCNSLQYWNNPIATAETMRNGWNRTGDLFEKDSAGQYFYRGRIDDVIKIAGLKVAPVEVEECLGKHPDVRECAVSGVPMRDGMVSLIAYVCVNEGTAHNVQKAIELKQYVSTMLASHKVPARVEFLDDLPRTSTGKLDRVRLKHQSFQTAT
jgi:benzoate-CoA ligase family protein